MRKLPPASVSGDSVNPRNTHVREKKRLNLRICNHRGCKPGNDRPDQTDRLQNRLVHKPTAGAATSITAQIAVMVNVAFADQNAAKFMREIVGHKGPSNRGARRGFAARPTWPL